MSDNLPNWRSSDPVTSVEAGVAANEFIGSHHERILAAIRAAAGPLAAEEISILTKIEKHGIGRRMSELTRAKLVERLEGDFRVNSNGRRELRYQLVKETA